MLPASKPLFCSESPADSVTSEAARYACALPDHGAQNPVWHAFASLTSIQAKAAGDTQQTTQLRNYVTRVQALRLRFSCVIVLSDAPPGRRAVRPAGRSSTVLAAPQAARHAETPAHRWPGGQEGPHTGGKVVRWAGARASLARSASLVSRCPGGRLCGVFLLHQTAQEATERLPGALLFSEATQEPTVLLNQGSEGPFIVRHALDSP